MPIRPDLYAQMIAEREAAEREATRFRFWFSVRTILICLGWQAFGAAVVVYAFHARMPAERARTLLDAGIGIAAGGTLLTVVVRQSRLRGQGYGE
jgi:hypothetical protein